MLIIGESLYTHPYQLISNIAEGQSTLGQGLASYYMIVLLYF